MCNKIGCKVKLSHFCSFVSSFTQKQLELDYNLLTLLPGLKINSKKKINIKIELKKNSLNLPNMQNFKILTRIVCFTN